MFYVKQSESTAARRRVPILMVDETDGSTPEVGLTLYGLLSKNGNTFAATAGTFAEAGYGQYYYQFSTGEIDTLGWAGIHITASGARNYDAIIHVTAYDAYSGSFIAPTDVWNADISSITSAGTAGSQLNLVASGGAGITAADVWNYQGTTEAASVKETLETAATKASDAAANTGASSIRDAVWETDISYLVPGSPGYACTYLFDAAIGTTQNAPSEVWSYVTREITGGTATTVTNAVLVDPASMTGIAGTVWNTDVSAFLTPSAGYDLTQAASGGAGITAGDVWNYDIGGDAAETKLSNAAFYAQEATTQTSNMSIADAVWNAQLDYSSGFSTSPPYASGFMYQAGIAATTIAPDVWNYDISAISGAGLAGTQLNLAAAPGGAGITAADVWNYTLSNATTADATVTLTQTYAGNAELYSNNTQNNTTDNAIRAAVWDFDAPNTGVAGTTIPYPLGYLIQAGEGVTTAGTQVWNYDISAVSGAGLAGTQLNLAALPSGAGITAGDVSNAVWDVPVASYTTNGTFGLNILRSDIAGVAGTVSLWTGGSYSGIYADTYRIDASYDAAVALKDVLTGIGASITGNITGDLSGSVGSVTSDVNVSTASMSGIANTVWSTDISGYTSPSAGFDLANASSGAGITAGDVWDFNITGFGGTNSAAVYVTDTNFIAGNIQTYVSTQTPQDVWTYAGIEGRTITGGIADTVTTVSNGVTVTTNNDKTGYSLSASQTFDLTGNITGDLSGSVGSVTSDVNVSTASMSGIANTVWSTDISTYATAGTAGSQLNLAALPSGAGVTAGDVWDYASRTITGGVIDTNNDKSGYSLSASQAFDLTGNITGNLSGSVGSVTNPVDITTNSMSGTAGSVWDYVTRTLTSGSGLTAGDVWTYATRDITGGTVDNVTNDVNISTSSMSGIANTVWSTDVSGFTSPSAGYDLSNATAGGGITAGDVWSYSTRTITGGIADTVTTVVDGVTVTANNDKTGYALSSTQTFDLTGNITGNLSGSVGSVTSDVPVDEAAISADVWSYVTRTLTSGSGISAYDVWNFDPTAMTVPQAGAILTDIQTDTNQIQTDISNVPNNVWSSDVSGYLTPGEAGFELSQAAAGSGLTAGDVWSYATRTTTGGVVDTNNDKTGYSLSSTQTFDVTGNITGNISGSVGSVTNPVDITTNAMSGTAGSVWNYVTRTLTSGGAGITAGDVWSYVLSNTDSAEANLVTAASGGAGITAGDVWTYATREITGGVIDTNNDKTDYALSTAGVNAVQSGLSTVTTAQVGQEVDASLLDVGLTSVVTGRIDAAVSSRLATSSYVTPPTTAAIATSVWTAATRTLTSGAGATAGDVWTYNIAGITSSGSAGAQLNDASVSGSVVTVVNGPYRLTSLAEGVDGRIDILADSVQTIQLNCLDGFGAPFNITGYTSLVNVYDVSGALAETYTPTVDFSQNGIISFDIDAVITGTTGRYTLVVELTAGAEVVQLGPLEILVRPL
jgi:hypothetical protein